MTKHFKWHTTGNSEGEIYAVELIVHSREGAVGECLKDTSLVKNLSEKSTGLLYYIWI